MKTIRLQVACRYLQRYGGELKGERGYIRIGTPPQKVIPLFWHHFKKLDVFLEDMHDRRIAHVTDLPTETGYLYVRTGAFRPEIAY